MALPEASQDALISLYRGEAAGVAAYDRALAKFAGQPEEPTLTEIAAEHREALRYIDRELQHHGIKTPEGPGVWGAVFDAIHAMAALVNDEVPLQVLQRGEEAGRGAYEQTLVVGGFSSEFTERLRDGLRRCQQHHDRLQALRDVITLRPNRPMI